MQSLYAHTSSWDAFSVLDWMYLVLDQGFGAIADSEHDILLSAA